MSDWTDQVPTVTQENVQPEPQAGALIAIEQSRAVQEVQAAMIIAQRFSRNEIKAEKRIVEACKRKAFAEAAQYSYPRGGTPVSGPSIRLAELAARYWGNLNYGIRELSQVPGSSEMEAYCHDLETNTRITRTFHVKHLRYRRLDKGGPVDLDDPRDIYEMTANLGARRLRAAILAVIPGDVIDKAMAQCEKTMAGDKAEPLIDRAKRMVEAFEEVGVSQEQIEARLGKRLDAILETELVNLRKVYQSLRDGMSKPQDWFGTSGAAVKDVTPDNKPELRPESPPQTSQEAAGGTTTLPPDPEAGPKTRAQLEAERDAEIDAAIRTAVQAGQIGEDGVVDFKAVREYLPNLQVQNRTILGRYEAIKDSLGQEPSTPPVEPTVGGTEAMAQARFERIKGAIRAHAEELAAYHLDPTKPNPGPQSAYVRKIVRDAMDVEIRKADQDVAEEMRGE